jgi:hypothetical protein
MAGISRVHGGVVAETLTGGYQTTYLLITGTNVGTADTGGAGSAITEGNFTKAIRALQTVATTVFIGPRGNDGFLVGVDGATAQPTGPAFDTDSSPTVAERVKAVLDTATGVTTTVAVKTLALAQFA